MCTVWRVKLFIKLAIVVFFLLAVPGLTANTTETVPAVSEKFLKADSAKWAKGCPFRVVVVPDFVTIGGCRGFRDLIPRILELHPSLVLVNGQDIYDENRSGDLTSVLRPLVSKYPTLFMALLDRVTEGKVDPAEGTHGRIDEAEGILRGGIIQIPAAVSAETQIANSSQSNSSNSQSCKLDHVLLPWTLKPSADCVWGAALVAAGYTTQQGNDSKTYIRAMPADFRRAELLVVDVTGKFDAKSFCASDKPAPVTMRIVRLKGKHKRYTVDVRYPQFRGGSRTAISRLNREIKLVVDRNINPEPAPLGSPPEMESNYTYSCDFSNSLVTPSLISLNFEFSNYLGGAHDAKTEVPLNAQIFPQFKLLKLEDVLGRKVNYSRLSKLYQTAFQPVRVDDNLASRYFSNFTFSNDGLTVRLPQGKFSAEAGECPSATVSYTELNQNHMIGSSSPTTGLMRKTMKEKSRKTKRKASSRIESRTREKR